MTLSAILAKPQTAVPTPQARQEEPWADVAALANAGQTAEARQRCESYLQAQGPSAQAYYWLGLLSDVDKRSEQACDYYRKAIYLDPGHREALTHLAVHLEAQGDTAGAQRLHRRAQQGGKHA